ncbi:MAG: mandelate racemase/muconate lactonizing enzyme family protein [Candidatus Latescibacterota bacterium]|nr:mandelate racemase/muconate lactonizing enzyme family protein [Candidatus Latescibacterota bacterium]
MKITDIKTCEARFGYVRVYSDEGVYGTGELSHQGAGWRQIVDSMKPMLIGKDPRDVDVLFETVRRAFIFQGAMSGHLISALTGVEIALWDLTGKAHGVPVYRLLGGKFRDRVRLYVDCARSDLEKTYKQISDLGFTAMKFDLDDASRPEKLDPWNWSVTPAELEAIISEAFEIRDIIGAQMDLAFDLHGRYDVVAGQKIAQGVQDLDLMWLEEPVPPENIDALAKIKASSSTPICVGENAYLRYGFRDLLEQQATDIIMPDISKCGGLSECRKIANMAEIYYVPMAPHNNSGPLSTLADGHTCASIPNFLCLEYHRIRDEDMFEILNKEEPLIEQGHVVLSEAPGLGAELNEDYVRTMLSDGDTELWH